MPNTDTRRWPWRLKEESSTSSLFSSRASKGGGPYVIEKTYPEDAFEPDEEWADEES